MGNSSSRVMSFYDMQNGVVANPNEFCIISTLPIQEQHCLILHTVQASKEETFINTMLLSSKRKSIVIYGRNSADITVAKKMAQLHKLGFRDIFEYRGGLFEWLLLREIYGEDNFKTEDPSSPAPPPPSPPSPPTTTTDPIASYSDNQKEIQRLKALSDPPVKTETKTTLPIESEPLATTQSPKPSLLTAEAFIKTPLSRPLNEYSFKMLDTLKLLVPETAFQSFQDSSQSQYPNTKPIVFPPQISIPVDKIEVLCNKQLPPDLKALDSVTLCKTVAAHPEYSKDIATLSIALYSMLNQLNAFAGSLKKPKSTLFASMQLSFESYFQDLFAGINKTVQVNEKLKTTVTKGVFVSFSDPRKTSSYVNDALSWQEQYASSSGIKRPKTQQDEYNALASILQNKLFTSEKIPDKDVKEMKASLPLYSFHGETDDVKQLYPMLLEHIITIGEESKRLGPFLPKLKSCKTSDKQGQLFCVVVLLAMYFETCDCHYLVLFLLAHVKLRDRMNVHFEEHTLLKFVVELLANIKDIEVINDKVKFVPGNKFEFSLFQTGKEIQTQVQWRLNNVNNLQITAAKEMATRKRDLLIMQVSHSNQTSALEFLVHYVNPEGSDAFTDSNDDKRRQEILTVLQKPHST